MEKIAIVGTGIAGMASAYFLHKKFDITVFEKNSYIGGHTNTVRIQEPNGEAFIDTGFMVYNHVTYPNLIKLFQVLNVEEKLTSMSFSVQYRPTGLEFSGTGLSGLFAQRKNIFSPSYIRFLREINRFNSTCLEVFDESKYQDYTLKAYCEEKNFSSSFLNQYLIPMSSAVWSTPPDLMLEFPAQSLIRFFFNHGFLGLYTQHPWFTLAYGSQQYREKLIAPFKEKILTGTSIHKIIRRNKNVILLDSRGEQRMFDRVIVASHADHALEMLESPLPEEQRLLSQFKYQKNRATLHSDESVMPRVRRAWSSWNYVVEKGTGVPYTVYWMNSLQKVSRFKNYFVNINGETYVDQSKILFQIDYDHPLFTIDAIRAQAGLGKLNDDGPIYFCGSYFNYGFHEDALTSSIRLCEKILGESVW